MVKIKAFDRYATEYDKWFDDHYWVYQSELYAIKKQIPSKGKGIEIGIGSGRFAYPLGIKIGLDPSSPMRKLSSKNDIKVIGGQAENLPFKDEEFDFALMVTTICFVDDILKSFQEAFRILKSNGNLIVGFVDKNSGLGKLYQERKSVSKFYNEATFYSIDEISNFLKKAGFKGFDITQTIFRDINFIDNLEPVKDGSGEGAFIIINASK